MRPVYRLPRSKREAIWERNVNHLARAKREANKKSSVRLLPQGKREAVKDQCLLEPVPFSFKNFSVSLTFFRPRTR